MGNDVTTAKAFNRTGEENAQAYSTAAQPGDVVIIADLYARPGAAQKVHDLLMSFAIEMHAEDGLLLLAPHRDRFDPDHFVVIETYRDVATIEQHRASDHYQHMMAELLPHLGDRGRWELQPMSPGDPALGRLR